MMGGINVSDIVVSLSGHDSGKLFIVLAVEGSYALLADGKNRRLRKPKRKNIKHLKLCARGSSPVAEKIVGGQITDSEIRKLLAIHRSETKLTEEGRKSV